jgi:hypothetical protein
MGNTQNVARKPLLHSERPFCLHFINEHHTDDTICPKFIGRVFTGSGEVTGIIGDVAKDGFTQMVYASGSPFTRGIALLGEGGVRL